MAPMISATKSKNENKNFFDKKISNKKDALLELRNYIEKNFEFVGNKFSEKAREVFYDKKSKKGIYGTASTKEKAELEEEGIELLSIPWVNKDN